MSTICTALAAGRGGWKAATVLEAILCKPSVNRLARVEASRRSVAAHPGTQTKDGSSRRRSLVLDIAQVNSRLVPSWLLA